MQNVPHPRHRFHRQDWSPCCSRISKNAAIRCAQVRASSEIPFDWQDPSTWAPALRGVEAAYVSYYPDLAVPGAPAAIERLVATAKQKGVKKLVLLSGRGEKDARRSEDIVRQSGLDFTLVRASWFAQNFDEGQLLEPVLGGVVAMPAGMVREPFVDAGDVADVAFAALTEDRHAGRLYEVTGPRLMTFTPMLPGKSPPRPVARVEYAPISLEEFRAGHDRGRRAGPCRSAHGACAARSSTDAMNRLPTGWSRRSAARRATLPISAAPPPNPAPGARPRNRAGRRTRSC